MLRRKEGDRVGNGKKGGGTTTRRGKSGEGAPNRSLEGTGGLGGKKTICGRGPVRGRLGPGFVS